MPAGASGSGQYGSSTLDGTVVPDWIGESDGAAVISGMAGSGVPSGSVPWVWITWPPPLAAARHSLPGRYSLPGLRFALGGAGQSSAGWKESAGSMYAFQMRAGKVPPCTLPTPALRNSGMFVMLV